MKRSLLCLLTLSAVLLASPCSGQDRWKFPDLNPFKRSNPNRVRARVGDEANEKWGLPGLELPKVPVPVPEMKMPALPKMSLPTLPVPGMTVREPGEPTTMDRINRNTKQFFGKTKQTLMPWSKPKKTTRRASGSGRPGFMSMWSRGDDEPKRVQSVNDFLALPRPY